MWDIDTSASYDVVEFGEFGWYIQLRGEVSRNSTPNWGNDTEGSRNEFEIEVSGTKAFSALSANRKYSELSVFDGQCPSNEHS